MTFIVCDILGFKIPGLQLCPRMAVGNSGTPMVRDDKTALNSFFHFCMYVMLQFDINSVKILSC